MKRQHKCDFLNLEKQVIIENEFSGFYHTKMLVISFGFIN